MPNKFQIAAAGLALLIARDLVDRPYRRKYREIVEEYNKLANQHNELAEDVIYLVNMINENDVELDEFDLIVLNNVTLKS